MSCLSAIISAFANCLTFKGRARRSEYWWFFLFMQIMNIAYVVIIQPQDLMRASTFTAGALGLLAIFMAIANISLSVRRMHDIGKSGWSIFINLIPFLGNLIFMYWCLKDSCPGSNQYGPNPKGK